MVSPDRVQRPECLRVGRVDFQHCCDLVRASAALVDRDDTSSDAAESRIVGRPSRVTVVSPFDGPAIE